MSSVNSSSWRPDLPSSTLRIEKSTLVGDSISFMVYGISFSVFVQTMYTFLNVPRRDQKPYRWSLIILATTLFSLITTFTALDLDWVKRSFIDNRNAPGGPQGYEVLTYSDPRNTATNSCSIVGEWISEGFLLYRCLVIFRVRHILMVLPILMYLAMIAMGCLLLFSSSQPQSSLWGHSAIAVGLPYFTISAALNILITTMISIRILVHRRQVSQAIGWEHATSVPYASVVAMLIESSALYSIVAIIFIGGYAANSYVANIFLGNLAQVQILAPLLIIFRVSQRQGWEDTTGGTVQTSLRFHQGTTDQHTTIGVEESDVTRQNHVPVLLNASRGGQNTTKSTPSQSSAALGAKLETENYV